MAKEKDDLEAVRVVAEALGGFNPDEQDRIIRWARERVGLPALPAKGGGTPPIALTPRPENSGVGGGTSVPQKDIRTFINEKNPSSQNEFAAVVAYFHRFEAAAESRRETITADDLNEACRLANRNRIQHPAQVLVNSHAAGLLDKPGDGKSGYSISTVGENLVAMALPGNGTKTSTTSNKKVMKKKPRATTKQANKKKA
jgi:hypothetical protein